MTIFETLKKVWSAIGNKPSNMRNTSPDKELNKNLNELKVFMDFISNKINSCGVPIRNI
jgi:hypothetical protein